MRSSSVMTETWPVRPWRRAFWLQRRLPSSVLGPVELCALRGLASSCFSEIVFINRYFLEMGFDAAACRGGAAGQITGEVVPGNAKFGARSRCGGDAKPEVRAGKVQGDGRIEVVSSE